MAYWLIPILSFLMGWLIRDLTYKHWIIYLKGYRDSLNKDFDVIQYCPDEVLEQIGLVRTKRKAEDDKNNRQQQ